MSLKLKRTCGSCCYLNNVLHPTQQKLCNVLGCIDTTTACGMFQPDMKAIKDYDEALKPLAALLRQMEPSKIPVICEILLSEKQNRRQGFFFHERVAVRYRGTRTSNYLSNFCKARVYRATKDGVYLVSPKGMLLFVGSESLLHWVDFRELRDQMFADGKFVDPAFCDGMSVQDKHGITRSIDDVDLGDDEPDDEAAEGKRKKSKGKKKRPNVLKLEKLRLNKLNQQLEDGHLPFFGGDKANKSEESGGTSKVISIDRGHKAESVATKARSKKQISKKTKGGGKK